MIKENANQPHTSSTQSETIVSQRLEGVRKAARENKETKFTALLHHMSVDLLRESFYALKRKEKENLRRSISWASRISAGRTDGGNLP